MLAQSTSPTLIRRWTKRTCLGTLRGYVVRPQVCCGPHIVALFTVMPMLCNWLRKDLGIPVCLLVLTQQACWWHLA